ncbi:MAG: hypothetical protein AB1894_06985 [Chloroflexota bacterium]
MSDYYGLPVGRLENTHLRLEYLAQAGPRLVRLCLSGSDLNLLAESPELSWETPDGLYSLHGGHRLWHAPEAVTRSSVPDDDGLHVEALDDGVLLTGALEANTGIRKAMQVHLHPERAAVTIDHRLTNQGLWAIELAAWAITQLPLSGKAVLPQPNGKLDADGVQPNRKLVLWPYTSWRDERLRLDDHYILLDARPSQEPAKWGYFNQEGWVGYFFEGVFFRKRFAPKPGQPHADMGCNVEIFIKDRYIELETLGPVVRLEPGQTVEHIETWEIYPVGAVQNLWEAANMILLG